MSTRRNKMIAKMMLSAPSETEQTMVKLVIERICADMCDFYRGFYANEGPGAMVYIPDAEKTDESMLYLSVTCLMNALTDFNNRDMEGPAEVIKKAIARAESIDPEKESLFIIQDKDRMSLIHYKHDNPDNSFMRM
jgi:phosphoribosyl 1,2-cyclic phosphodiesterase